MRRLLILLALLALGAGGLALAASRDFLPPPLEKLLALPERLYTQFLPPRKGKLRQLTEAERSAFRELAQRLDAEIVWSSNRDGNHELYLMDLRSQEVRRLTRHPHVDFFSRFSPDGKKIVFMRSQRPWVSFREETAWDIYLVNVDGTGEQLLAREGYAPAWSPDGRSVVFSRGNRFVRVELANGKEEILLDANQAIPGAHVLGSEPSPDGRRLASTVRRLFDGVAIYDLDQHRLIPMTKEQACQIVWMPDGQSVLWVATGGRGGTRIMTSRADGSGQRVFMDLPGEYSHEYFPKVSNDGRWLIWGAAAEGHEHDRADYEIFLWEIGTPWEKAIRLTYYTGNDQWPDIYVKTRMTRPVGS